MAYTPTVYVNDNPPALNGANLNKAENELEYLDAKSDYLEKSIVTAEEGKVDFIHQAKFYDGYYNATPAYTGSGTEQLGAFWGTVVVPVKKGETVVISGFENRGGVRSCWLNSSNPADVHSVAWTSGNNNGEKVCVTDWIGIADYNYKGTRNNLKVTYDYLSKIKDDIKITNDMAYDLAKITDYFNPDNFMIGGRYHGVFYPSQTYRITTKKLQTALSDIYINCEQNFLFIIEYFENGVWKEDSGYLRNVMIPKGTQYDIIFQRYLPDTTETADITEFLKHIWYRYEIQDTVKKLADANNEPLHELTKISDISRIENLESLINGLVANNEILENRFDITDQNVYSHYPTTIIVGNYAYVVCIENSVTHLESDGNVYVCLKKINLNDTSDITSVEVAGKGTFGGVTFTDRCSAPTIILTGEDEITIVFYGIISGSPTVCKRVYTISTGNLSNITVANIIFNGSTYVFNTNGFKNSVASVGLPTPAVEFLLQTFNLYNSEYYVWLGQGPTVFNGCMFKTSDFVNYEYVFTPDFNTGCSCEIMSEIVGDNQYIAFRRPYIDADMLIAKLNMQTLKFTDMMVINDCASRPAFFKMGDDLYLFHSLGNRDTVDVILINRSFLKDSQRVMQFGGGQEINHVIPVLKNGELYYAYKSIGTNYANIRFTHHSFRKYNWTTLAEKLLAALNV